MNSTKLEKSTPGLFLLIGGIAVAALYALVSWDRPPSRYGYPDIMCRNKTADAFRKAAENPAELKRAVDNYDFWLSRDAQCIISNIRGEDALPVWYLAILTYDINSVRRYTTKGVEMNPWHGWFFKKKPPVTFLLMNPPPDTPAGRAFLAEFLALPGLDVSATDDGEYDSALVFAAKKNLPDYLVIPLVRSGANPDESDNTSMPALDYFIRHNRLAVVRAAYERGADIVEPYYVGENKISPAARAAAFGFSEMAALLRRGERDARAWRAELEANR